jgi:opacity protein-like surface antigen
MTYRNLLLVCAAAGLFALAAAGQAPPPAQTPAPKPAPDPPPAEAAKKQEPLPEDRIAYIRRFSFGGRVHFQALGLIKTGEATEKLTVGPTEIKATGEGKSNRPSLGVTMQLMLTGRIGIGADLMRSRLGFREKTETRVGTDNTATVTDERKLTTTEEQTRVVVYDLPILGRYYSKDRFEEGWRWFVQGGVTARRAGKTVTFTKVDDKCCQQIPRAALHRQTTGITAGGGIQAMDAYGIKVMPEIRYTWWRTRQFDLRSAKSARHQVEVGIGITF